ncbi:MAG: hypothetical protein AAGF75_02105, partial [Cyanobacteria bacterium P01_H01_bin.130]
MAQKYFWVRFNTDGTVAEQRKHGEQGRMAEDQIADGFDPIEIPEGRVYGSWVTYHRDEGFTWPVWEREWAKFRDDMTATDEFLAVDIAAETSTRLSHRIGGLSTAIANLVKEGPTEGEYGRLLYQWGRFKAA